MKTNELIERYIYAVTRQLPYKLRADIEKELRSLISDMLEERCGDVEPTERDVNVVLAELGKPSELAAKYDPDGERSLIGPRYFRKYIFVMKIVLICVMGGMTVAALLSSLVDPSDKHWLLQVGEWISNIITSLICAAAMVTGIFAFFEYKGIALDSDELSALPRVPEKDERISKGECIGGIVFNIIALVVLCFVPQVCCAIMTEGGDVRTIQVFTTEVMRGLWPVWAICCVLGVSREVFRLFEGRYTKRLAVFSCAVNVVTGVLASFALLSKGIMNPAFVSFFKELFAAEANADFFVRMSGSFNVFLLGVIIFALVLDTVTTIVKTVKAEKNAD